MKLWIAVAALCVALAGVSQYAITQREHRAIAEARFEAAAQAVREAAAEREVRLKADASVRQEKRVLAQDIRRRTDVAKKELARAGAGSAEYARVRDEAIRAANAAIESASGVP